MLFLTDIETTQSPARVAQENFEELERRHAGVQFEFNNVTAKVCQHNLGYRPASVTVVTAQKEFEAEVEHVDTNQLVVRFNAQYSGVIIIN